MQTRRARCFARGVGVVSSSVVVFLHAACGGSSDPRCTSLCQVSDAPHGPVCSQASASSCVDQCNARISSATPACSDCLLQGAFFGTGMVGTGGCFGNSAQCPSGSVCSFADTGCTYCNGDMGGYQACLVKEPRTEVDCSPKFQDPAKCSSVCPASG